VKRYALFSGSYYYPCGGWDDFAGTFDTAEEALAAKFAGHDWWQVVDLHTGKMVSESK
jgi:hypothetical protein